MPIQILMPALSPTMTEGNLARWLKKEGDVVKAGDVIAEIETDKATMEVEAVDEGKLLKILIPGGTQGIKVNTPIAILAEEGEEGLTSEAAMAALQTRKPTATPQAAEKQAAAAPSPVPQTETAHTITNQDRIKASPLAKRIAKQMGRDLKTIHGTGPGGRIVKVDVLAAPTATAAPLSAAPSIGVDARAQADKLGMAYDAVPNSSVRKIIAKRLSESKQTAPHFYLSVDCELDELMALRKRINEVAPVKTSVNDFVIRAVAMAMRKIPAVNASWTEEAILQYKDVDISVAVATPGGLVTPIVRNADIKTLEQISAEMRDLGLRAREGKLKPREYTGGGITISNLGMFGIKEFSAIINPPQSCILAVGAGEQRPVVKSGTLAVATVMTCTLSVDHRSVDGAVGAGFLTAFKSFIEKPHNLVV